MTLLRQPGAPMPCPPLFPAAATTVTPLAAAFFTADERDENDASQLDDVSPLSAGDVLRRMLMLLGAVLSFLCFLAVFFLLFLLALRLCTLSSVNWPFVVALMVLVLLL